MVSIDIQRAQSIVGTSPGRPEADFYPTPPYATKALLEKEQFSEYVWEPACGDGAISKVLTDFGYRVYSDDLYDYDYGTSGHDFLTVSEPQGWKSPYSIVTNPPFKLAIEFMERALSWKNCEKLALLCKLAFLEGQERSVKLEQSPLHYVWVFRKRLQLTRNGDAYKNGGMIAFAWFVWEQGYTGSPKIGWI